MNPYIEIMWEPTKPGFASLSYRGNRAVTNLVASPCLEGSGLAGQSCSTIVELVELPAPAAGCNTAVLEYTIV